jgi:hypothetical protein
MWVGQGGPIPALSHPHTYMAVLPPIVDRRDRGGVVSGGAPCGCPWGPVAATPDPYMAILLHTIDKQRSIK